MDETKNITRTALSDLREFLPDRPVVFDPPRMMYVWNDDSAGTEINSPCLREVFYVNPELGLKRVFAHGDGSTASKIGVAWDHCAETCVPAKNACSGKTKCETKVKRSDSITLRELSEWLSSGKGQVMEAVKGDGINPPRYSNSISYARQYDDAAVPCLNDVECGQCYYMVRKYGENEFADPTREYIGKDIPDFGIAHKNEPMQGQCFANAPDWSAVTKET